METNTLCHGFSVSDRLDIQQQFSRAAQRYVERWQCRPLTIWHHEATQVPGNSGDVETAVDNQIPRGAWYFEISAKGGDV